MSFGIYVHIPYCKQLCPYCDFSRYLYDKIMPPEKYVDLLKREIAIRAAAVGPRPIQTLYFGGGTPSLFDPKLIVAVIDELAIHGFNLERNAELSIEIDPGTIDEKKLDSLIEAGFNRFSVGAQSFSDRLLKLAGRKHSSQETRELLGFMKTRRLNYSFDLLFSLPTQSRDELRFDLDNALHFGPSHLSAYLLNVADNHPMNRERPSDDVQVEMFHEIEQVLLKKNILRYEISNFAQPGFESKHNLLYWQDQEYWGIGVSAHSYLKLGEWGSRFSNPKRIVAYEEQVMRESKAPWSFATDLDPKDYESLARYQSLSDYCHTSLRLTRGLSKPNLIGKYSVAIWGEVEQRLRSLQAKGLVAQNADFWALTPNGKLLSNLVFEKLSFSATELDSIT